MPEQGPKPITELAGKIAQYFRDFLETDFHKHALPKRRVQWQTDTGYRCGLRVPDYPGLNADLWKLISRPVQEMEPLAIRPRMYTRSISENLRKVIAAQVRTLPESVVVGARQALLASANRTVAGAREHPELWIAQESDRLDEQVAVTVVRPLLTLLDGMFKEQAYSLLDSVFALESDLVARITQPIKTLLPGALAELLATGSDAELQQACGDTLTHAQVVQTLTEAFADFQTSDAYNELKDLATYVATQEQMQLYLYFGQLGYDKRLYPLFYAPANLALDDASGQFRLAIDSHLFVNRRAISYVLEQLAQQAHRAWIDPSAERILYVPPVQSLYEVIAPLYRAVANGCDLAGQTAFGSREAPASTASVTLAPRLALCVNDRSEDALLNDYEQILSDFAQGGSAVANLFEGLVGDVLLNNPVSIAAEVNGQWDDLPMTEHLVDDAPVPLNEEQRKILLAVRAAQGKVIVVEGPPGTGKSHTITAIAADCAFHQRSCLVLSDKTEALDVVEDKLTQVMAQARHHRDFPNPVLRLGRQESNFKRLVSNQAMTQIDAYARAAKQMVPRLQEERAQTRARLQQQIDATVAAFGTIALADIAAWQTMEQAVRAEQPALAAAFDAATDPGVAFALAPVFQQAEGLCAYLSGMKPPRTAARLRCDALMLRFAKAHDLRPLGCFKQLDANQNRELSTLIAEYRGLRRPVIGYLFRGAAVRALNARLNALPTRTPLDLRTQVDTLAAVVPLVNDLERDLTALGQSAGLQETVAALCANQIPPAGALIAEQLLATTAPNAKDLLQAFFDSPAEHLDRALHYIQLGLQLRQRFGSAPDLDYPGHKRALEKLNITLMNHRIDQRLVAFVDEHRADARAIAGVISNRQKFPEDKFGDVRAAFPVIIASIREFGEFMPLVPNLFDVVVLDEASQISVAQALPALLRARKVVVMGDAKQYSNVKAAGARTDINEKYRAGIVELFKRTISDQAAALERLARFDIRSSVLEFAGLCASYATMLRKHARSCPELIHYSSTTFYGGQLQALKIRGNPLPDVIRFDQVQVDPVQAEHTRNRAEAQFVLARLLELLEEDNPPTVGVITPFREQHKVLVEVLYGHPSAREFEDRLRLKVMTFDSAQGEERNIIFYSCVASPGHDRLNHIFPADVHFDPNNVEEKLRLQRLNVGFSRAQEMVWFVTSMPVADFRGAFGKALQHFSSILDRGELIQGQTDPNSPMEVQVAQWLESCAFVQRHRDRIEIVAQFELGEYLRQLDPTYQHPAWKVDFLLTYDGEHGPIRIVIEYDGFEYHFTNRRAVHAGNAGWYMNPGDVERQLTLESYGYRFVRLNRFNVGTDPARTLSDKLRALVHDADEERPSSVIQKIADDAEGLLSKQTKQCTRCKKIKPLAAFHDPALGNGAGGHGRVCMECKKNAQTPAQRRRRWAGWRQR